MYRPARDAPQFRHGPPGPPPTVARPRMMNPGQPFAPPVMQGRGPMISPPFPGGQQQHAGFGPPPSSMPPHASQALGPGRPMASAPPAGTLPPPPGTLPPPPGTLPSVLPPPGIMPSGPRPPGMVPSVAPRGPSLGQPLPGPPPGGPPSNLLPSVPCHSPADVVPFRPAHSQASQPHCSEHLPPHPPKPNDNEMIRNIEILSQFVVKNGPEFESMARIKQAGDPKFSFLFGGDPGSNAAIGLEYFQWFKMKCQLEAKTSMDAENRGRPVVPLDAHESSQQFTGPATASEAASSVPAVTDMEMDMDMEDDIALPMLPTKDGKNFLENESEIEVSKPSDQQQKGHTLSSLDSGPINDREKNLMAVSENVEASQSKLQEAKEMAFEGPCVEDLSPVRHSPKELQHTMNVDKQVSESLSISKEDPHVAGDGVPARDAIPVCHHEAFLTDPVYKPTEASSAVDAPSEIVELAEKKIGLNFAHNDMECKEIEAAAKPCHDGKSLNELNNRISLDPDNVKSDTELHGKPDQGSVKVDKFGRLIRKGGSDSESEGAPYTFKAVKMGHSCSRSPSPGYERWRKRSRSRSPWSSSSPWRRSRWSRSHSRSPKRRRSRSRTPFRDFRRGGDARGVRVSRGRGTAPACNDFAHGRCYRGASCKFLHQETTGDNVGRWSGPGRSRERTESRQDIKSFGGKENSLSADVDNAKNTSADRLSNELDTRNVGERRNQEPYRGNDWATPVCNNFTRGRCFRGVSCKFFHPEGTGDNVGRWSGGGRGRERIENRQDITKSYCGKESSAVLEVEKMKHTSPNILPNEHYRHNLRDQRSQERDRGNDRRVRACIYFARGRCQRGLSCKFLHQVSTGDNGGRWSGAERGREWKESRHDMPKSFGVGESSAMIEMDKPMNSLQDRYFDGHGSYNSGKRNNQEAERHNDSWVGNQGFPVSDAFSVLRPPLSHSVKEELQPPQSQTLPSEVSPSQHFHKEDIKDIKHHLLPREDLCSKPVPGDNIGAHPLLQEGLYAPSPLVGNLISHELGENLHSESLPKDDSQFQVKDSCAGEDLHPKPFQTLSRDIPSLTGHCLSSGQSLGPGSLPMPSHNALQGNFHPPSHLNLANNVDPPPPGCPTNSCVMNQPANLCGIGGSALYQDSPITAKPNSVSTSSSTVIPIAFTEQRSQCSQSVSEPFSLPHLSSSGQKSLMSRSITSPQLSSPHMYIPGAQLPSTPLPISGETFGEKQTYPYSHSVGPHMSGLSAIDQPSKDVSVRGDKHDSLYVSVEPVSFGAGENLKKKMIDSAIEKDMGTKEVKLESCMGPLLENVSPHDKGVNTKDGTVSGPQGVVGNTKHKDGAASSLKRIESDDVTQADVKPGVVENESPVCDGKNWSPGAPLEVAAAVGGDVDMDQTHTHDESKKSKEIRTMKLFRSVLAEFVKEVLKPTWREGHMSKEAFKTIVKKVVDKVAGTLQSHQIPKTQEKIDQYVASSRLKLTKLVQGYVDKYVKS